MNFTIRLILLMFSCVLSKENNVDWNRYCDGNENHLLCLHASNKSTQCEAKHLEIKAFPIRASSRVSRKVNSIRIAIAKGFSSNNKTLNASSRMQELKWDPFLAEMAVARCRMCNITYFNKPIDVKFKTFTPGEMILSPNHTMFEDSYSFKWPEVEFAVALEYFFNNQKKYFDVEEDLKNGRLPYSEYIEKRPKNELLYSIIQLMKDDNYLIGCARSTFKETNGTIYFYACFTGPSCAEKHQPVILHQGEVASNCTGEAGKHINNLGLCKSDRKNFPSVYKMEAPFFPTTSYTNNITTGSPTRTSGCSNLMPWNFSFTSLLVQLLLFILFIMS